MVAQTEVCHPPKQLHFKEPFLHKSFLRIWIHIKDMFGNLPDKSSKKPMERLNLPEHRNLEVPGSGAAAHMSLHLLLQCQRAHQNADNDFSRYRYRGEPLFTNFDDQNSGAHLSRVVLMKRPLDGRPDSVNIVFALLFQKYSYLTAMAVSPAIMRNQDTI